jgi:hypothetical protein
MNEPKEAPAQDARELADISQIRLWIEQAPTIYEGGAKGFVCLSEKKHALACLDRLAAHLAQPTESAQAPEDGTAERPFTATYNSKCFKRHDSELFVGICERDDAFEINVIPPRTGPTRHYRINADGSWTDLAPSEPSESESEQGEADAILTGELFQASLHADYHDRMIKILAARRPESAEPDELTRWQDAIRGLVCILSGSFDIDGGSCDSGDPLDFTLTEITEGFTVIQDKLDATEARAEKAEGEAKALRELNVAYSEQNTRYVKALAQVAKAEQEHCYVESPMSEVHDLRKCGDIARATLYEYYAGRLNLE